jgi:hypothetical protein
VTKSVLDMSREERDALNDEGWARVDDELNRYDREKADAAQKSALHDLAMAAARREVADEHRAALLEGPTAQRQIIARGRAEWDALDDEAFDEEGQARAFHPLFVRNHPEHTEANARYERAAARMDHPYWVPPDDGTPEEPLPRDPGYWTLFPDETNEAGAAVAEPAGAGAGSFGAVADLLRGVEPGAAPANAAQPIGRVEG